MKKKLISLMLAAGLVITTGYAQEHNKISPPGSGEDDALALNQLSARPVDRLARNEISMKALRSFAREYKHVQDARWHKGGDWFAAYFTRNNIQVKVFYDCWGNNKYTMRSYLEPDLPKDVRHHIKSTHYDYNIYHINEITVRGTVIYFIKLEGKKSWMDVKIVDNEMATIREYTKS